VSSCVGSPRAFGLGLWPGPRRQARWGGRGLRRSRVGPEDRFCGAVRNNHAPLRGAAVGYENWVLASGGVCGSVLARGLSRDGAAADRAEGAQWQVTGRPSSPQICGPFEAALETGAGAPCRVTPVAAACACVNLLY
jgi:hypothetical protein